MEPEGGAPHCRVCDAVVCPDASVRFVASTQLAIAINMRLPTDMVVARPKLGICARKGNKIYDKTLSKNIADRFSDLVPEIRLMHIQRYRWTEVGYDLRR